LIFQEGEEDKGGDPFLDEVGVATIGGGA